MAKEPTDTEVRRLCGIPDPGWGRSWKDDTLLAGRWKVTQENMISTWMRLFLKGKRGSLVQRSLLGKIDAAPLIIRRHEVSHGKEYTVYECGDSTLRVKVS